MDCSPPGSSVHGILQTRIPEWTASPSPGDLPDPGIKPSSPALQDSLSLSHQGLGNLYKQLKIIHNFILKSRTDIAYVGYIHVYVNICKLYKKKYMLKSLKETFQIVYSGLLNCSITSFWYLLKG